MMAKVYAPNKQFTGTSAGVSFYNGVGECADPVLLKWFERHGYTVEMPEPEPEEVPPAVTPPTTEPKPEEPKPAPKPKK